MPNNLPVEGQFDPWEEDIKQKAVELYALTGNSHRVAEVLNVPSATVRYWKSQQWWIEKMRELVADRDMQINTKFTDLIEKAQATVEDRLENGDVRLTKTGEEKRIPVSLRDAAIVTAIMADKRHTARKELSPTKSDPNLNQQLQRIAEQFAKFVQTKEIEGEIIDA